MTRAALLERLECERVAPPPRRHRNVVRHYEADITARRLEAGYADEVAAAQARRNEASASTCIDVRLEVD